MVFSDTLLIKPGSGGAKANDESDDTTPIGRIPGGVAIHSVKVVHIGNGHVATSRDIITIYSVSLKSINMLEHKTEKLSTYSVIKIAVIGPKKMV